MKSQKLLPNESLLFLSMACAAYYCKNCENNDFISISSKVASTALLALHRHRKKMPNDGNLFTVSLAFHTLGDLLIELSEDTFLLSLASFFVGHAFYIKELNKDRIDLFTLNKTKIAFISMLAVYAAWFSNLLMSKTEGVVQTAIPLYTALLFFVVTFAAMQKKQSGSALLSACLYAASDNLIGLNMFMPDKFKALTSALPSFFQVSSRVTFPLYFAGQAGAVQRSSFAGR